MIGKFQKYDHGTEENLKLYGVATPPEYNLSNIKTKVHIMYGSNDYLVPKAVRTFVFVCIFYAKI